MRMIERRTRGTSPTPLYAGHRPIVARERHELVDASELGRIDRYFSKRRISRRASRNTTTAAPADSRRRDGRIRSSFLRAGARLVITSMVVPGFVGHTRRRVP
jgi:hypothetical protein